MPKINKARRAVVVGGCRIPFLRSGTGYRELSAYDLARLALKSLLERIDFDVQKLDRVILGNVIVNNKYSNVARQAALAAGIPERVPAYTVTLACVSANQAITNAVDLIESGRADWVIAGGTESLTDVPIPLRPALRDRLVAAQKSRGAMDYLRLLRGLRLRDFLPDAPAIAEFSTRRTMGEDCDRLAARLGISRREQDEYALRSHQLAAQAQEKGLLEPEVTPVRVPPEFEPIDRDNGVRGDSTLEKLQSLRPAFVKPYGTITAGNSSFLTDGAAAVLLAAAEAAEAEGFSPSAAIRAYAYSAQGPAEELLLGPAYATPMVLDAAGVSLKDIGVFEFHEAFAAQVLANLKCLASPKFAEENLGRSEAVGEIPLEKLNTRGGSLSLGHPFGATGARLVLTTANRLQQEDAELALVASCAAGAVGNAMILERLR